MNLKNLKHSINSQLFKEGLEYYIENRLKKIESRSTNYWEIQTDSPGNHKISVQLNNDFEITKSFCNCSDHSQFYCKHEVASYIAISEKLLLNDNSNVDDYLEISPEMKTELEIEKIINSLSQNELRKLLIGEALKNPKLKDHLLSKYLYKSESLNPKINYKQTIRKYVHENKNSDGFINYWSSKLAVTGAEILLSSTEEMVENKDFKSIIPIAESVIEELVPAIQYSDDSEGLIGEAINYAFDLISLCSKNELPESTRKDLFNYCLKQSQEELYSGWTDWIVNFLFAAARLIRTDEEEKQVLDTIDKNISKNNNVGFSSSYYEEYCILIKYEICTSRKQPGFTDDFIKTNIQYPAIKEIAVQNALKNNDFEKAEKITKDGIYQYEKDKRFHLVKKWNYILQEVYEQSGETDKLLKQVYANFENYHDFDCYDILKNNTPIKEWESKLNTIITNLKNNKSFKLVLPGLLGEMYVRENMKEELLKLLKQNPNYIVEYDKFLIPEFQQELIELYTENILFEAKFAYDIKSYLKIIQTIKHICNLAPIETVRSIIQELKESNSSKQDLLNEIDINFPEYTEKVI